MIPNDIRVVIPAALLLALGSLVVARVVVWCTHRAALVERAKNARQYHQRLPKRAVADERRRIARELHDRIAHHVSVLGVLAAGARRSLRTRPRAAHRALASIEEDSRATLRQMRRLLDQPRTDAEPTVDLSTQPGLSSVETLMRRMREAGLSIALHVDGAPDDLHPEDRSDHPSHRARATRRHSPKRRSGNGRRAAQLRRPLAIGGRI